jgi:hypothetical protein|tara:strand:+ start:397 stop:501 length:105 start_codon:yes stop_codon:yes gene_type:complete
MSVDIFIVGLAALIVIAILILALTDADRGDEDSR